MPPVRLFVGNLPYQATEDDLRTHFSQVGQPTQIVRPLDRETGRARGFAFVEYAERAVAEEAIKKFDGQLFMGRPLAVSEARAREDRGPGGPPRSGGYGAAAGRLRRRGRRLRRRRRRRLRRAAVRAASAVGGGYSGGGPPAAPATHVRRTSVLRRRRRTRRSRFKKNEDKPRGPIPTKFSGRMYDLDDTEDEDTIDITPDFMKHEIRRSTRRRRRRRRSRRRHRTTTTRDEKE